MKPKKLKDRIYFQFFLKNICLLMLPILICAGYLHYLNDSAQEQIMAEIEMNLSRTRDLMDLEIRNLEASSIAQIMVNKSINDALNRKYLPNTSDMIYLVRAQQELGRIFSICENILDAAVVSIRNNIIINTNVALCDISDFYRANYEDDSGILLWKNRYFAHDLKKRFIADFSNSYGYKEHERIISYVQYVPSFSQSKDYFVWIRWRESDFLKSISYTLGERDSFYVRNYNGEIIATKVGSEVQELPIFDEPTREGCWIGEWNGYTMIFAQTFSDEMGLYYQAAINYQDAISEIRLMRLILVASMIFVAVASLGMSLYFAKQNADPIRPLVSLLNEQAEIGENASYGQIMNSIGKALRSESNLMEQYEKQKFVLRGMLIEKLLSGGFLEEKTLDGSSYLGINLNASFLSVLIVHISMADFGDYDSSEQEAAYALTGSILERVVGKKGYIHNSDQFNLVILFKIFDNNSPDQELGVLINKIKVKLDEFKEIDYRIVVGGITESLNSVPSLYRNALEALNFARKNDLKICNFKDVPIINTGPVYNSSMELKLVSNLRAGNIDSVGQILKTITKKVSANSMWMNYLLQGALMSSMYRALDGMDENMLSQDTWESIRDLNAVYTFIHKKQIFPQITEVFLKIAKDIADNQKNKNQFIVKKMFDIINKRYNDPQFCMQDMLDNLGMSSTKFQLFFKEQAGSSFYKYIEQLRIREACRLLKEQNLLVMEVSEQVGYDSPTSFRRAFKKVVGMPPSDYRTIQENK